MKIFLFSLLIIISFLLQISITTIPLVVDVILVIYVLERKFWLFWLAFLIGILLDVILLRQVGVTSLFLIAFLILVNLYENKFEVLTVPFILFTSFLGSFIFTLIFNYNFVLLQSIISALFAAFLFIIFSKIFKIKKAVEY